MLVLISIYLPPIVFKAYVKRSSEELDALCQTKYLKK